MGMEAEHGTDIPGGAMALEHLTGPCRGIIIWLRGSDLDISLGPNRLLRVSEAHPDEPRDDVVARLHYNDGTYEIMTIEDRPVWVNGTCISAGKLAHRDMIEFGDTGPLTRFHLYREDRPVRKMVTDILVDGLGYLRVSRQPVAIRVARALGGLLRRLMQETTLLFRVGVILAIIVLVTLAYQQSRLNILLQQRIESSASRLDGFAGTLTRAREEALTRNDLKALNQEIGNRLSSNAERLAILERRTEANARVIAESKSSVVFLQGSYGFREYSSERMLRHAVNEDGRPLISPMGQPLLTLEGNGPVAARQFTGTAFVIGRHGVLVTNRHVALPWEKDANIDALADQGLEPVMVQFIAYLPDNKVADMVELVQASEVADLAVLRFTDLTDPVSGLELADSPPVPGDEIIVMGYPTGLRTMLAQSGEEFIEELQTAEDIGFWSVAARLADKGHIAPLASRGIVSQATPATIVYDAETTHGGSGGPVLDVDGRVVAVNAAILPEYGGSNLGVPVDKVRALLETAGLR